MLTVSQSQVPAPADFGSWLAALPPQVTAGVIAAIVALIIAIITNVGQGRRERARDAAQRQDQRDRDREQREDQRRRDDEQREDQRTRDLKLWQREDDRRFIAEKRVFYSKYLSSIVKQRGAAGMCAAQALSTNEGLRAENSEPIIDVATHIRTNHPDLYQDYESTQAEVSLSRENIELIAPQSVLDLVEKLESATWSAYFTALYGDDPQEGLRIINKSQAHLLALRVAMRLDLAVDSY